jgi:hypothetical protein
LAPEAGISVLQMGIKNPDFGGFYKCPHDVITTFRIKLYVCTERYNSRHIFSVWVFGVQNKYAIQSKYANINGMDLNILKFIQKSRPNVFCLNLSMCAIKRYQILPFETTIQIFNVLTFLVRTPDIFVHCVVYRLNGLIVTDNLSLNSMHLVLRWPKYGLVHVIVRRTLLVM